MAGVLGIGSGVRRPSPSFWRPPVEGSLVVTAPPRPSDRRRCCRPTVVAGADRAGRSDGDVDLHLLLRRHRRTRTASPTGHGPSRPRRSARATPTRSTALPDATTFAEHQAQGRGHAPAGRRRPAGHRPAHADGRRRCAPSPSTDAVTAATPSTGGWPTTTPTSATAIASSATWAAGEDPPFAETAVDGKPISLGMDDFAERQRHGLVRGAPRPRLAALFREPIRRRRRSRHHVP